VSSGVSPWPLPNKPLQPTGPPAAGSVLSKRSVRSRLSGLRTASFQSASGSPSASASEAPLRSACDAGLLRPEASFQTRTLASARS